MRLVVISAKARADAEAIADFIASDNPAQASRFVAALMARCMSLSVHPLQGRPADEIAADVRILVFPSYVILHRVFEDRVSIDRILHGARDRSIVSFGD